jgi:phenylpropionate dioxygenase-like ring-hydroxylating dioxygenase large terminal subunit
MQRDALMAHAERLADLVERRASDSARHPYRVAADSYLDSDRWRAEVDRVFKALPQVVGLSADIPSPGAYMAVESMGLPVVMIRDDDGQVHLFLNVCRHRGTTVAPPGCGQATRLTCPYHGWAYNLRGALVGVPFEPLFGAVDRGANGLVELPVAERHGLIFGLLRRDATLDIDDWLGEFDTELASLELAGRHVIWASEFPGPNWKVCKDGFLETYHFPVLHRDTVNRTAIGNAMAIDTWAQHSRVMFPRRTLTEAMKRPRESWQPEQLVAVFHAIFPNILIAEGWGEYALFTQILPGERPDESHTVQKILSRSPIDSSDKELEAKRVSEYYGSVTEQEDYVLDFTQQKGIASGANTVLTFGAHELGLHHFHAWLDHFVDGGTTAPVIEYAL